MVPNIIKIGDNKKVFKKIIKKIEKIPIEYFILFSVIESIIILLTIILKGQSQLMFDILSFAIIYIFFAGIILFKPDDNNTCI